MYRLFLILLLLPILSVMAQDENGIIEITSPTEGQQLFGSVLITGTVSHPSLFAGYSLDWSNARNPDDVWIPIQRQIAQQVTNGVLGQWDTVGQNVPDGTYKIRLQMFLSDGTVQEIQVENLNLINSVPTSIPTPIPEVPLVTPQDNNVAPVIEQPPSPTPRPVTETIIVQDTPDVETNSNSLFNFSAVQSAFCTGVYFSMGLFALVVGYLLIRAQLSPYTRRLWWQIRSELEDGRKDR